MAALRTPSARWVLILLGVLAFAHYWLGRADGSIRSPRAIADDLEMQPFFPPDDEDDPA